MCVPAAGPKGKGPCGMYQFAYYPGLDFAKTLQGAAPSSSPKPAPKPVPTSSPSRPSDQAGKYILCCVCKVARLRLSDQAGKSVSFVKSTSLQIHTAVPAKNLNT